MTELLYLANIDAGYERRFSARVVSLPPGGLVLDRTLFYAVGGGQPADRGTLARADGASWTVVDVGRSAGTVVHRLKKGGADRTPPRVGDELEGSIDWTRRYDHMRSHTAQHLLSARLFAATGLRTREAIIGGGGARIVLEGPWPADRPFRAAEDDLRAYVDRALPVAIRFLPRSEYDQAPGARSGLVPLAPQVDPVRIIEIDGVDSCPCGGTHVRNTSEIGNVEFAPILPRADGAAEIAFRLGAPAAATPSG